MFIVNNIPQSAIAQVSALQLMHTEEVKDIEEQLHLFLKKNLPHGESVEILLSGENGDMRPQHFFEAVENILSDSTVARFKHLTGDFATVSALALHMACQLIETNTLPDYMIKIDRKKERFKNILIYNQHKGIQHSFILVSNPQ